MTTKEAVADFVWFCKQLHHKEIWSTFLAHVASSYAFYMLLTELPSYLNDELDFDIEDAGIVSVVPYICTFLATLFGGRFSDWMVESGISLWRVRVGSSLVGLFISAIVLGLVGFVNDKVSAVALLTVAVTASGYVTIGFGEFLLHLNSVAEPCQSRLSVCLWLIHSIPIISSVFLALQHRITSISPRITQDF